MAVLGDLLFYRRDQVALDDVLRHQVELLRDRVDALPDKLFTEKSDEEIAAHVAKESMIQALKVDFEAAKQAFGKYRSKFEIIGATGKHRFRCRALKRPRLYRLLANAISGISAQTPGT